MATRRWAGVAVALGLPLLASLGGCGADTLAGGPMAAAGSDGGAVADAAAQPDGQAGVGQGGDGRAQALACDNDLECLAHLVASPCAKPRCSAGQCRVELVPKGTACAPTGLEPAACQQTVCNGEGSCVFEDRPDGTSCGEGPCGEACLAGKCVPGGAADDGNPCTTTACVNGQIQHLPVVGQDVVCQDAKWCVGKGVCAHGTCVAPKVLCDDGVACTVDFCQPGKGCVHLADDTLCPGDGACTTGVCDAALGACKTGPKAAGSPCDDGNVCTKGELCDGVGGCSGGNNGCACGKDTDCTLATPCAPQACVAGVCVVAKPVVCAQSGGACVKAVCSDATGTCVSQATKAGTPCDDGDPCTLKTACQQGVCAVQVLGVCDDGNPCTQDGCTPGSGCSATPWAGAAGACDDGDACTSDACNGGACRHAAIPGCQG